VDTTRPPSLLDKKMFSQNIYNISSEDLGKVVQMLDARCEACIKRIDQDDIEIDVDAIDNATFHAVHQFVQECLPGNKKALVTSAAASAAGKKKIVGGGAGAAVPGAAESKPKKPRLA
jgi:predicted dinucleotide-utilizing enzyme